MELYFAPPSAIDLEKKLIVLSDQEFHHAIKVLRHAEGEVIHCIDGIGTCYEAKIESIQKH